MKPLLVLATLIALGAPVAVSSEAGSGDAPASAASNTAAQQECYDGFVPLSGWWADFCGDETRNFTTGDDYGAMHTNAEALRLLAGGERLPSGYLELEVYFATDRIPQGTGGLHILSLCSGHRGLGTPRTGHGYASWLRPDFQIRSIDGDGKNAELQIGTYNANAAGEMWYQRAPGKLDIVVDVWRTGIRLTPHQWIPLRFEWRRTGSTVSYVLNSKLRSVQIDRESADIYALAVGNMDGLRKDGQSVYGGTPEVRYRNLRWGSL
ncbi:MAG TPA: hypothetical protein VNM87_08475 [Candidatus Udaeobacter sp.]|nr:hypothetical protein [Candidatus Udaeobacter sp.]